jgi:uncharacterized protein
MCGRNGAWPRKQIVLFGRSLGSAVASELAREHVPGALILESPFRSVPRMAQDVYPFLPARWLARMDYDNEAHVRDVTVRHPGDPQPRRRNHPLQSGRGCVRSRRRPKKLLTLRGGHNTGFLDSRRHYMAAAWSGFFRSTFDPIRHPNTSR